MGPNYLVMEYVEGEDLKGPMTFDDALPIIQQLIDGIEAAHEKNIIHRDLKPANIKITPEGVVKILDFGLAKATDTASSPDPSQAADPGNSPTLTIGATAVGTILGTAAYMAPEQAKGKTADRRSDIWSFGVIVYELLTGQRLFQGETAVEILGSVLNKDLDISAAPPRAHKLLRWCLEKDRKKRLASISDALKMLETGDHAPASIAPTPSKLPWVVATALAVALIGALALWAPWRTPPPENRPLVRLDVDLGSDVSLQTPNGSSNVILIARRNSSGVHCERRGRRPQPVHPKIRSGQRDRTPRHRFSAAKYSFCSSSSWFTEPVTYANSRIHLLFLIACYLTRLPSLRVLTLSA